MGEADWRAVFGVGDELVTEKRSKPFTLLQISALGIKFQAASRVAVMTFERLDALWERAESVRAKIRGGRGIIDAVNEAWDDADVAHDYTNESQYWALVEARRRKAGEPGSEELVFEEGGRVLVSSSRVERDPDLRRACIAAKGTRCVVCGLDLGARYPGVGEGFIHVHHLRRVALLEAPTTATLDDVVPVCPNCHAMLHRREPPMTPEELRRVWLSGSAGAVDES